MITNPPKKKHQKVIHNAFELMPKDATTLNILGARNEILSHVTEDSQHLKEIIHYISCRLDKNSSFGITFDTATEVLLRDDKLTKLPHTPDFIAGVINNRGALITVIDLAKFFHLQVTEIANKYIILVTHENITAGLLIYEIDGNDSYEISALDPPLTTENVIKSNYIIGLHKGMTAIINIKALLSDIQTQLEGLSV